MCPDHVRIHESSNRALQFGPFLVIIIAVWVIPYEISDKLTGSNFQHFGRKYHFELGLRFAPQIVCRTFYEPVYFGDKLTVWVTNWEIPDLLKNFGVFSVHVDNLYYSKCNNGELNRLDKTQNLNFCHHFDTICHPSLTLDSFSPSF